MLEDYTNNIYYAAYIKKSETRGGFDYSTSYSLSKFKFTDYNERELILTNKEFYNAFSHRIVSAFIFVQYNILAVCFLKLIYGNLRYTMNLHDLDLNMIQELEIYENNIINANEGEGIFFKAIYLKNEYVAFIFFKDGNNGQSLVLRFLKIIKDNNNRYNAIYHFSKNINEFNFVTSIKTNEFYKINKEKLLFVSTISQTKLILMFFEVYSWYTKLNIRAYQFPIKGFKFDLELTVDYFNNFLMFTSTMRKANNEDDISSILLFFSYPNGTDFYINIFPYFTDTGYYSNENLIQYLLNKCTIDNNILDILLLMK